MRVNALSICLYAMFLKGTPGDGPDHKQFRRCIDLNTGDHLLRSLIHLCQFFKPFGISNVDIALNHINESLSFNLVNLGGGGFSG